MSSAGRGTEWQVNRSSRKPRVSATVQHARLPGGPAGSGTHARVGPQLGEVYRSDRETTAEGAPVAPGSQFARKLASRRLGKHTVWPRACILSALCFFLSVCFSCARSQSPSQLAGRACGYIYWDLGRASVTDDGCAGEDPPRATTSSFLASSPPDNAAFYTTQPRTLGGGWGIIAFFVVVFSFSLVTRFVCDFLRPRLISSGKRSQRLIGGEVTFRKLSAEKAARLRQLSVSAGPKVRDTPRGNGARSLARRVQNDRRGGRAFRRE